MRPFHTVILCNFGRFTYPNAYLTFSPRYLIRISYPKLNSWFSSHKLASPAVLSISVNGTTIHTVAQAKDSKIILGSSYSLTICILSTSKHYCIFKNASMILLRLPSSTVNILVQPPLSLLLPFLTLRWHYTHLFRQKKQPVRPFPCLNPSHSFPTHGARKPRPSSQPTEALRDLATGCPSSDHPFPCSSHAALLPFLQHSKPAPARGSLHSLFPQPRCARSCAIASVGSQRALPNHPLWNSAAPIPATFCVFTLF